MSSTNYRWSKKPLYLTVVIYSWLPTPLPPWWHSAQGPTHQTQRCPLGSMPVDGSSRSRTVGSPSMHIAKHSYGRERGLSHIFCSPWQSAYKELRTALLHLWESRFWFIGNVGLEKVNVHHPTMGDNMMVSWVAQSTTKSLRSWKGLLICAMSITVLIIGKTKHTFLVIPADNFLVCFFK